MTNISYKTLIVTFNEPIKSLDNIFADAESWGAASLKEWVDGYESSRFTQVDERRAVITSEYNMEYLQIWLTANTPIADIVAK